MNEFPILTATLLCPALALLLTLLIPGRYGLAIKVVNALCALVSVILAVAIWAGAGHSTR